MYVAVIMGFILFIALNEASSRIVLRELADLGDREVSPSWADALRLASIKFGMAELPFFLLAVVWIPMRWYMAAAIFGLLVVSRMGCIFHLQGGSPRGSL